MTVVSALHTVSAHNLGDLSIELDEDVPVCGDSREDKRRVAELIGRVPGLRPGERRARSRPRGWSRA